MPKIITDEWSERKPKRNSRSDLRKMISMRLPRSVYYDLCLYAGNTQMTLTEAFVVAWDHYQRHLQKEGRWPPEVERFDREELMANAYLDLGHAKERTKERALEKKGGVWNPPKPGVKIDV